MAYIIELINPQGVREYIPENFGHGVHEHTLDKDKAERFILEANAKQRLQSYIYPAAFWESERRHSQKQQEKFKNWKCSVISV